MLETSKARSERKGGSAAVGIENYGKVLAKLRREGKDKGDDYNAFLERYMSHSCALMCQKNEDVVRKALVDTKGFILMLKVMPDVLLQAVFEEVLLACSKEPVAISQSQEQVFMYEVPGKTIGQVGLEEGVDGDNPCKLLNIFLKEGLGVLWARHKYCKILLLKTDSIGFEDWKDCTFHLDYSGDTMEKIAEEVPSKRPLFMIMPFAEGGVKIDIGYHGRKVPKLSQKFNTKSIKKGNVMVVNSLQWQCFNTLNLKHVKTKGDIRCAEYMAIYLVVC